MCCAQALFIEWVPYGKCSIRGLLLSLPALSGTACELCAGTHDAVTGVPDLAATRQAWLQRARCWALPDPAVPADICTQRDCTELGFYTFRFKIQKYPSFTVFVFSCCSLADVSG